MRKSVLLLSAVAAFLTLSCEKDQKTSTEFKPLSETTINVDKAGGTFEFQYEIVNPTSDAVTAVLDESVDWITNINTHSVYGKVTFDVAANEEESSRQAVIGLEYGTLRIDLTVIQGEGEYILPYQIEITQKDYMSVVWDVTAKDQEMTYLNMIVDKATWDSFGSFDEYFEYSINVIAQNATANMMDLEDYLEHNLLVKGDTTGVKISGLLPSTEYVVYAIGLTPTLDRLSEVCYVTFATDPIEMLDVQFDIKYENVTATSARMSVTPSDNGVYYMFAYVEGSGYTSTALRESYQLYVNSVIDEILAIGGINLPMEEIVMAMASVGPDSYDYTDLTPATVHTGYAVAIDLYTGILNSEVSFSEFTTEELVGEWESTLTGDRTLDLTGAVAKATFKRDYYGNGYNNWIIEIGPEDGVSGDVIKMDFMVDTEGSEDGIPSGTYQVASASPDDRDPVAGEFIAGEYFYGYLYTWFKGDFNADGKPQSVAPATGGTIEITNNGDNNYTVEFSLIDDSPLQNVFSGSWSGTIVAQ